MNGSPPVRRRVIMALVIAGLCFCARPGATREKIDVITLRNGDRITGEIKQLELGVLSVGTDNMGTVAIEWVAVGTVESPQLFEFTETDGERFVGTISPGEEEDEFDIVGIDGREYVLGHDEIVRIAQLERGWRDRWSGYVDLGATIGTANRQTDLSIDAGATYRSERFRLQNTFSTSASDREVTDGGETIETSTSRAALASTYQRFLRRSWFWFSQVQFARNEELDLQLRSTATGGLGRYLLQSTRSQLSLAVGLSALREDYIAQGPGEWSSELVLAGGYQLFVFEGRETSITLDLSLLPSLTVSDRFRVEFSSSFRRKLVRDFTISLSLDESYDSKPPEGAQSSDLRLRTSLGWSF